MPKKLVLSKLYLWPCAACWGPSEVVQRSSGVYLLAPQRSQMAPDLGAHKTFGMDFEGGVR